MSNTFDEQPNPGQFLPDQVEPPTPDELLAALENELADFPVEGDLVVVTDAPPPPIGRGWAFDFHARRFVRGPSGASSPLGTRGRTTLTTWVEKTLNTAAHAHPIYSDDYGAVDPFRSISEPIEEGGGDMEGRVREALTYHPRISDVTDFQVSFDPDDTWLSVSFTLVLDDDTELPGNVFRLQL